MKQKNDTSIEDLHNVQTLCVYGEGDLEFFLYLKKWLDNQKDRNIIFLEDDEKKFRILKNKTKTIFPFKKTKYILIQNNVEQVLKQIAWECIYLNLKFLKSSIEKRRGIFQKIELSLNELHLGANATSNLYSDFGIKTFENIYGNLLKNNSFIFLESLKNKFKNIPAIIAGAGPSLDKDIHLIKKLYNKALIFAGGSALNIFSKNNIKHYFSGFIDQLHLFKRFKSNHFFENTFFYSNQMSHYNLSIVHANKVLVSDYGAYPLESWMYDQLNIKQKVFEIGWNVTTFLIKIAAFLGCNPIYFVGLDLCYEKDKYAKDVVKSKETYSLLKTKNIDGKGVYTQKDWILAKKWIEEFALANKKIKFVNTSTCGLKIENVFNLNLNETQFEKSLDLSGYVHSVYQQQQKIRLDKAKVIQVLDIIKNSLQRTYLLCDEYLLNIAKYEEGNNFLRFQKEIAYVYLLEPLWQIWKYVILRDVENKKDHILINKLLFFKSVISDHLEILWRSYDRKI